MGGFQPSSHLRTRQGEPAFTWNACGFLLDDPCTLCYSSTPVDTCNDNAVITIPIFKFRMTRHYEMMGLPVRRGTNFQKKCTPFLVDRACESVRTCGCGQFGNWRRKTARRAYFLLLSRLPCRQSTQCLVPRRAVDFG